MVMYRIYFSSGGWVKFVADKYYIIHHEDERRHVFMKGDIVLLNISDENIKKIEALNV